MKDCPICLEPVRLGATRMRVSRKQGVYHYIAHIGSGTPPCVPGEWSTVMLKPYPKRDEDRPRFQMVQRWETLAGNQGAASGIASTAASPAQKENIE